MKKKYYAMVLTAGALWGCISIFFRIITGCGLTSIQAVTLRVFTAAITFGLFLLAVNREAFKIRLRDLPLVIGTGVCSLAVFNFCYFNAIELSSVGVAAVLLYTAPIFVMLLSALIFKEKITVRKFAALMITLLGCLLVTGAFGGGERLSVSAVLYGVGSGVGYALYSIFGKLALNRGLKTETVTFYTFVFAFVTVAPFSGFTADIIGSMSAVAVLGALGLGIVCCVMPYILYTKGLCQIEPGRAAILATAEPVVAAVVGAVVFHETITPSKTAGIALVVSAIVILSLVGKKSLQSGEK